MKLKSVLTAILLWAAGLGGTYGSAYLESLYPIYPKPWWFVETDMIVFCSGLFFLTIACIASFYSFGCWVELWGTTTRKETKP